MPQDDLLQPSLPHSDDQGVAIYSAITAFATSYFGGPLAAAIIGLLNSHELGLLRRDWWLGAVAVAAVPGYFYWLEYGGGMPWLRGMALEGLPPYLYRLMAVGFFGLVYMMQRRHFRSMMLLGLQPKSGWLPGIAAVIAGIAYSSLCLMVIARD